MDSDTVSPQLNQLISQGKCQGLLSHWGGIGCGSLRICLGRRNILGCFWREKGEGRTRCGSDLREGKKNLVFLRKDKEVLKRRSPRAAISHGKSRRARLHVPQCVRACGVCVCIVSTAVPVVDSLRAPRCQAVQPRREGRGGRLHARLGRRAASGARAWGGVSLQVGVVAVTMTAASSGVDWAAGSILRAGCISSSRPLCCYTFRPCYQRQRPSDVISTDNARPCQGSEM